ncbi:GFRA2 protein, partial [Erithacus rubecula]|nr:GFRA2 protein [Erithacus rubecula]
DELLRSLAAPPSPAAPAPPGWRVPVDCVRANELCAGEPGCSSRYRTLRQCLAGRDRNTLLANKECQLALEVLQESALYHCRCKRGMKRELQCLQIYWSIHMGLTEGEEFYEASPYEPVTSRLSDIFRLASIFSGNKGVVFYLLSVSTELLPAGGNLHLPLLGSSSSSSLSFPSASPKFGTSCSILGGLMHFWGSLWDGTSAEIPLFPQLFLLCRSRLADYHTNCQATFQSLTSCPGDNFQACLGSYAGLIGFDITPNYVDASTTSITISPWCSCKGSGNMEEECEKFLRDFTENPCLRNAIQAFGNGTDMNVAPKIPNPAATVPPKAEKSPALPDDANDSNAADSSVISTCTSLQEQGLKPNKSKEQSLCYSEAQLTTDVMPDQKTFMDPKAGSSRHRESRILLLVPVLIPVLGL